MKKTFLLVLFLFLLSSCTPDDIFECEESHILRLSECVCPYAYEEIDGVCIEIICEEGEEFIDGECQIPVPVCEDDETYNEETNECDPFVLVCFEPFVKIDDVCVNPNIVYNYENQPEEITDIFYDLDGNKDYRIDRLEAKLITELDISYLGFNDISFLQYFTGLQRLNIAGNGIKDISPINEMKELIELDASNNIIENICDIEIPLVETLNFSNNLIAHLDCFSEYEAVKHLDVSYNYITRITKLNNFEDAITIDLSYNDIFILSGLDGLTVLEELDVSHNDILFHFYFADLITSPNLHYLDVSFNNLSGVNSFNELTNLTYLNIDGNSVPSITSLTDLTKLEFFSSKGQAITDIQVVKYWDSIKEIHFEGKYLERVLPIMDAPSLEYVDMEGIEITYDNIEDIIALLDIDVEIDFGFDLDPNVAPLLISNYDTIYTYEGDFPTLRSLGIIAYDLEDGALEQYIIRNGLDLFNLRAGEYTLDLRVTDSDGFETTLSLPVVVREKIDMSNLVVYVTFQDYTDYEAPREFERYDELYNGETYSVKDYYQEVTNGNLNIETSFTHDEIYFYTASRERGYYQIKSDENPFGYTTVATRFRREDELIRDIIRDIEMSGAIGNDVRLDANRDGIIDSLTFLVAGDRGFWNQLLWPHTYWLDSRDDNGNFNSRSPSINGKFVEPYNFQILGTNEGESIYLGVAAHELFHILGGEDLYHYFQALQIEPIGDWGLMGYTGLTPVHPLQYSKNAYAGFDIDPITVSTSGQITLNRTTLEDNNVIIIDLEKSNEYLYIEYRTKTGEYESDLAYDGVIVYRVDKDFEGNYYGMYDENMQSVNEVHVFRESVFDVDYLRENLYILVDDGQSDTAALRIGDNTKAGVGSSIPIFHSDGTEVQIVITLLDQNEDTATVQIDFED